VTVPANWTRTTLGALGRYVNGRGFRKHEWSTEGRPIIRIQNLTGTSDVFNYYRGDDVPEDQTARPGDLLVSWAATLGAYLWTGPEAVINQHIFKVVSNIDARFHKYLLDYKLSALMRETHGSGMVHITRGRFDSVPVDLPTLDEQRRIVEILEDHLSRLDAAEILLTQSMRRLQAMEASSLASAVSGPVATLGDVADIQGGIQKQPKRKPEANAYPFLRVANVTAHGLDLAEVHLIELFDGDLLVVEGNGSPSQIGRAAVWDGSIEDCVHQNHLIRVRPKHDLLPAYLEAVWNSPAFRQNLTDVASSTSGLYTLSVAKLARLQIPVPSLDEQQGRIETVASIRSSARRLRDNITSHLRKTRQLRRALLSAAFSGQLHRARPVGMEEFSGV
jgi:type I restriction enzyme S subunit